MCLMVAILAVVFVAPPASAQTSEQDIVNKYLQKAEKKHTYKLGWASFYFQGNRVNRDNNYNRFALYTTPQFSNGQISLLDQALSFGADFGLIFQQKFAWFVGGEYWMKQGNSISGDVVYNSQTITDPSSELKIFGLYTGMQYYLMNPPSPTQLLTGLALRVNGSVGYYSASWDLWEEYQNLNLSTAATEGENATYKGSAPGFSIGFGVDYPINFWNMAIGADMNYLYLNFTNVAWYNSQDEEIVATYGTTPDHRVDLQLSGVRGKVELKRFFSW
jgi:hypothetical protein